MWFKKQKPEFNRLSVVRPNESHYDVFAVKEFYFLEGSSILEVVTMKGHRHFYAPGTWIKCWTWYEEDDGDDRVIN